MLSYRGGDTSGEGRSREEAAPGTGLEGRYLPSPADDDGRLWVRTTGLIQRDPQELYTLWRNVEAAPMWQEHLSEVRVTGETTSHWVMRSGNKTIEWDSEIVADEPGRHIAWRSIAGEFEHAGEVMFEPVPGTDGTQVTVLHQFELSKIASAWETMTEGNPKRAVLQNLRHFKTLAETGQALPRQDQPHPSKGLANRIKELSFGETIEMPPATD